MTVPKRRYTTTARATKAQERRERIGESAIAIYCERPSEDVAPRAGTTVQTVLRAVLDSLADGLLQQSFLEPGGSSGASLSSGCGISARRSISLQFHQPEKSKGEAPQCVM
jgi:hypothetical protein